jgi:hypothetical protein
MNVMDRKTLHKVHVEGIPINLSRDCMEYENTVYNMGCIVTVVDEVAMTAKEKKPWEVITTLGLMDNKIGIDWNATLTLTIEDLFSSYSADEQNFTGTIANSLSIVSPSHCRGVANAYFSGFQLGDSVHPPLLHVILPISVFSPSLVCRPCSFQQLGGNGCEKCRLGCKIGISSGRCLDLPPPVVT